MIFQLKVVLKPIKPSIWRRILVDEKNSLDDLHVIIQSAMGWSNHYLHSFECKGQHYKTSSLLGTSHPHDTLQTKDVKLKYLNLKKSDTFLYIYEFVDYWEHQITIEDILEPNLSVQYPLCLDGRRACPPEDCDGPAGYEKILYAFKNKKDPKHQDINEWLPKDFNPEYFNRDEVNHCLSQLYSQAIPASSHTSIEAKDLSP